MAFPAVQGTPALERTIADATSYAPVMPTGITAGEAGLALVTSDGAVTLSTSSSGWTKVTQASHSGGGMTQAIFWAADFASAAALTVTSSAAEQFTSIIARVSGHRTGETPTFTTIETGLVTDPDFPSHTLPAGAEDALWLVMVSPNTSPSFSAAPAGYGGLQNRTGNGSTGDTSGWAWRQLNAATEDPGTGTISASRATILTTLAIRPAAATGINGSLSRAIAVGRSLSGTVQAAVSGAMTRAVPLARSQSGTVQAAVAGSLSRAVGLGRALAGAVEADVQGSLSRALALGRGLGASAPAPLPPPAALFRRWLLAAGTWDDPSGWDDDALWLDGPPARPAAHGARVARMAPGSPRARVPGHPGRGPARPPGGALWLIGPDTIIGPETRVRGV